MTPEAEGAGRDRHTIDAEVEQPSSKPCLRAADVACETTATRQASPSVTSSCWMAASIHVPWRSRELLFAGTLSRAPR